MTDDFELKDSGERRTFESGAVRDRGELKPRPDLISPHAQMREGMVLARGGEKYGIRNYEKGMPISECLASAQRHIEQYKQGDTIEDHLAQARCNLGFILHYLEEIKAGRMDPAIDDMPKYATPRGERDFCRSCGASIPPILGEGTCPCCPFGAPDKEQPCQSEAASMLSFITNMEHERDETLTIPPENILYESPPAAESLRKWVEGADNLGFPTFYVAGPMRGHDNFNFPAFDAARKRGEELGYNIISPADLDREAGIGPNKIVGGVYEPSPAELHSIIQRDTKAIMSLRPEMGDGIAVLPDWANSTGALAEVALARWLGLRIVDALDFLEIK